MPVFHVNKSNQINAPAAKVYEHVRDFKQWPVWSPWLIAEPNCKLTFAEDGRSYAWDGRVVGSGELAVTVEDAPKSIDYRLSFFKPWKSVNTCRFEFAEENGGAEVTWSMEGTLPFFLFWMKNMMAAYVGMDFQRGLSMLKDYIETGAVPSKLEFASAQSFPGCHFVGVRTTCPIAGIGPAMEDAFDKVGSFFKGRGLDPAGAPLSIYHKWKIPQGLAEFTCGLPVAKVPGELPDGLVAGDIPAGSVYTIKHTGPYRHLGNAWSTGEMRARAKPRVFMRDRKIDPFEIYEGDPQAIPEDELVTVVHFPSK